MERNRENSADALVEREQSLMDGLLHVSESNRREISAAASRISQKVFKLTGEQPGSDAEPVQDKAGVKTIGTKEAGSLHANFCDLNGEYTEVLIRLREIDEVLFKYIG